MAKIKRSWQPTHNKLNDLQQNVRDVAGGCHGGRIFSPPVAKYHRYHQALKIQHIELTGDEMFNDGYVLKRRRRPARSTEPAADDLRLDLVDEVDEVDGDEQLALVWCEAHAKWGMALDTAPMKTYQATPPLSTRDAVTASERLRAARCRGALRPAGRRPRGHGRRSRPAR